MREDAHERLLSLRQAGSALNYAIEFKTLANIVRINDEAKYMLFKVGFETAVKLGLSYASEIHNFQQLVCRAITVDQV